MAFKSYTHCVQPADYKDLNLAPEAALTALALLDPANPLVLGELDAALMGALRAVLDYMLNGKLICLGGDRCAVGTIATFETVADKSFPDSVDNDFSFNLILWPFTIDAFVNHDWSTNVETALDPNQSPQADLIRPDPSFTDAQKGREASSIKDYAPAKVELTPSQLEVLGYLQANPPAKTDVPVLHCECEGSRIHDLLAWLDGLGGLGTGVCGWSPLGIPVGSAMCDVIDAILAPVAIAGLVVAWFAATDGNPDDARTDPGGGQIFVGDTVVVSGRWSYDAGHTGWNELHPVKTLQRIDPAATSDDADFAKRWCSLTSQSPSNASSSSALTADQQTVADAQGQPANQWTVHPAVDGCKGSLTPGAFTHAEVR